MIPKRYNSLCLVSSLLLGLAACAPDIEKLSDPNSPSAGMIRMAEQMVARGDNAGAVSFYQQALQNDSKSIVARKGLAATFEKMGNKDSAADMYREALNLTPKDAELLRSYGRVLISLDRPSDAKDQYEKALNRDSEDVKALNGLGVALDYLSEHEKAQKKYKEAIDHDSKNVSAVNNLAYSYILSGKHDEAIKLLEPYQRDPAATAAMRQNLALAYGLKGMDMDAERVAKMDLPLSLVRANMDYYRRKRAELSVSTEPYAEAGSYSTQAMALGVVKRMKGMDLDSSVKPTVVPELSAPGGVPRFVVRLTGGKLEEVCKDLVKQDMPCVVKKAK